MGVGGKRQASAPLPPGKPVTYCIEGWVGPRDGLDRCGKSLPQAGVVEVYSYSFFNLGARWGWVVNAKPQPLYHRENPLPIL